MTNAPTGIVGLKAACALLVAGDARGTGFLVSPERLLTCHHVVKSAHLNEVAIVPTWPQDLGAPLASPVFQVLQALSPHFTGREQSLRELRQQLHRSRQIALWGLGGLGKTQTAVAFAHRYRDEYAAVLWLPGDSASGFEQGLIDLAGPLAEAGQLRGALRYERDPAGLRSAVLAYLREASDYLLICDNVDSPGALKGVWPRTLGGHVLLTSRSQDIRRLGVVVWELAKLSLEESQSFFTRCYPPRGADEEQALCALSQELDGLPLALTQAAAYLTRHRSRYDAYLRGYQQKKLVLLEKGLPDDDYPRSVASTWALSLEQVEASSAAAVALLKLCALLQPDAIPEELLQHPVPELGQALQAALQAQDQDEQALDELLAPLLCHALLQRSPDNRTLSLHRLVQQALRYRMPIEEQRRWAEAVVAQLGAVFPDNLIANWSRSGRLLGQALTACEHIETFGIRSPTAAYLLNAVGYFLCAQARNREAERLVRRALALREELLGAEHLDVAASLNALGEILFSKAPRQDHESGAQAHTTEAELLIRSALTIREEALGPEPPHVASCLNNLAAVVQLQGKLSEAELLHRRALAILEKTLGDQHPDVARGLNNLGLLLHGQGRPQEAEQLYHRAISLWERTLDGEHPAVAYTLDNLGLLLYGQGRRTEATPYYERALEIREKTLPSDHPLIARTRERLDLCLMQGPWRDLSPK